MQRLTFLMTAILLSVSGLQTSRAQSEFNGVWKLIEINRVNETGAEAKTENIQPSLHIVSYPYYSTTWDTGGEKRPFMPEGTTRENITPEQMSALFKPFYGHAGTFSVEGTTCTYSFTVALWSNYQNRTVSVSCSVDDDVLTWRYEQGTTVKWQRLK